MTQDWTQVFRTIGEHSTHKAKVTRPLAEWVECSPIPDRVIPKTQKMVLVTSWLNTQHYIRYGSRVKWSNPGKGAAPSLTPWCCSNWKGSLWVTLDYGHQLYYIINIYLWMLIMSCLLLINSWFGVYQGKVVQEVAKAILLIMVG